MAPQLLPQQRPEKRPREPELPLPARARQTGAGPAPGPPRASLEGLRGPPKAPLEGLRKAKGLPWKAFGLPPRRGCDSSFCRALAGRRAAFLGASAPPGGRSHPAATQPYGPLPAPKKKKRSLGPSPAPKKKTGLGGGEPPRLKIGHLKPN